MGLSSAPSSRASITREISCDRVRLRLRVRHRVRVRVRVRVRARISRGACEVRTKMS